MSIVLLIPYYSQDNEILSSHAKTFYLDRGRGGANSAIASSTTVIAGIYFVGLQMARKCNGNGETLALTFVGIGQIF